jgi:hypothetical protein
VFAEGEVVPRLQPAMIRGGKLIEWSAFDHRDAPRSDLSFASHLWADASIENRNYRNQSFLNLLCRSLPDLERLAIFAKVAEAPSRRIALTEAGREPSDRAPHILAEGEAAENEALARHRLYVAGCDWCKRTTTWSAFIRTHLALLAGTDFFTT